MDNTSLWSFKEKWKCELYIVFFTIALLVCCMFFLWYVVLLHVVLLYVVCCIVNNNNNNNNNNNILIWLHAGSQIMKSNLRRGACTWLYDAYARRKRNVFSFDLNVSNDELFLISIGIVLHNFGAATEKARVLLYVVCCIVVCCMLYVVCCIVVCCMLYVKSNQFKKIVLPHYNVLCWLYVLCFMLYVVCFMLYVVWCMLYVICFMLYVVFRMLYVVWCMLYVILLCCFMLYCCFPGDMKIIWFDLIWFEVGSYTELVIRRTKLCDYYIRLCQRRWLWYWW